MSAHREIIKQANERGITLQLDKAGDLKIGGDYTEKFVGWAKRNKADLVNELRSLPQLDRLLDEARAGTDFSVEDCRTLFSPLDLQVLVTGELTVKAARHFLGVHQPTVCRRCLAGGCRECNFYGRQNDQRGRKMKPDKNGGTKRKVLKIVPRNDDESRDRAIARTATTPSVMGAATIAAYAGCFGDLDINDLVAELEESVRDLSTSRVEKCEEVLMSQAVTLNAMFNNLAQRAAGAQLLVQMDLFMRYALKAQNQCRNTLLALASIRNPPGIAFVKQANIGRNIQVNNGNQKTISENELLEQQNSEWLDRLTPQATSRVDSALEAMGAIDGSKIERRQKEIVRE